MRFKGLLTACVIMLMLGLVATPAIWAQYKTVSIFCPVRINEVMINPADESRDEFIELYNSSCDRSVDICDWTISDNNSTDTIQDFTGTYDVGTSGTEIPPGGYAIIVDRSYRGEYNDYIEDFASCEDVIMVRVDDYAIGDGLDNTDDELEIQTDWHIPFPLGGSYQKLTLDWDASDNIDSASYEDMSWERDRYDTSTWIHSPDPERGCTPGVINNWE